MDFAMDANLWMMPCNSIPLCAALSQRFEVSNPDRIKAPLAVAVLWLIDWWFWNALHWLHGLCLVAGSPVRSQCRFPGLQALVFSVPAEWSWSKLQNPFRIFLFWAVLNGWTLLISWFWEGIQYAKSDLNSNSLPLELETQGRMLVLMTARVRNSVESDPSFAKHFPMPSSVKQVTEIYWKFMWNVDALLDG